jgi:hypothetical protein
MKSSPPFLRGARSLALTLVTLASLLLLSSLAAAQVPGQPPPEPQQQLPQPQPQPQQTPQSKITFWKDLSATVQSFVTVIAILGGVFLYLKRRQRFPRARITHQLTDKLLSDNKIVLRAVITVVNQGEVLLSLESGFIGVQQVVPCPQSLLDSIRTNNVFLKEKKTEAEWKLLTHTDFIDKRQIEPGEEEEFYFDFLLDAQIKTVIVYSYFKNKKIRRKELGWNKTTIYDLSTHCQQAALSQTTGGKPDDSSLGTVSAKGNTR